MCRAALGEPVGDHETDDETHNAGPAALRARAGNAAAPSAGPHGSLARQGAPAAAGPLAAAASPAPEPAEATSREPASTEQPQETLAAKRARVLAAHTSASSDEAAPTRPRPGPGRAGGEPGPGRAGGEPGPTRPGPSNDEAGDKSNAQGAGTLDIIIKKLDVCVLKKAWYCQDMTSSNSVHFIAKHVVEALPAKMAEPDAKYLKSQLVREQFPRILIKVLLDNPTYEVLHHFTKLFPEMDAKGCYASATREPLVKLAEFDASSTHDLDLDGCDLDARIRVIDSVCYRDFERTRATKLLARAKTETGATREDTLKVLLSAAGNLSDLFQEKAKELLSLFSTTISLPNRIVWALQNPTRIRLAEGFCVEPEQQWQWASLDVFLSPPPTWPAAITPPAFFDLAAHVILGGGRRLVKNPIVASVCDLVIAFDNNFGTTDWSSQILINAGASKLGAPKWLVDVQADLISDDNWKTCVKILGVQFPHPEPDWLVALKKARRSLKHGDKPLEALESDVNKFTGELTTAEGLLARTPEDETLQEEVAAARFNLAEATALLEAAKQGPPEDPPKKKPRTKPASPGSKEAPASAIKAEQDAAAESAGDAAASSASGAAAPSAAPASSAAPAPAPAPAPDPEVDEDDLGLNALFGPVTDEEDTADTAKAKAKAKRKWVKLVKPAKPTAPEVPEVPAAPDVPAANPEAERKWQAGDIVKVIAKRDAKTYNNQQGQVLPNFCT